jgi:hypothetical protein
MDNIRINFFMRFVTIIVLIIIRCYSINQKHISVYMNTDTSNYPINLFVNIDYNDIPGSFINVCKHLCVEKNRFSGQEHDAINTLYSKFLEGPRILAQKNNDDDYNNRFYNKTKSNFDFADNKNKDVIKQLSDELNSVSVSIENKSNLYEHIKCLDSKIINTYSSNTILEIQLYVHLIPVYFIWKLRPPHHNNLFDEDINTFQQLTHVNFHRDNIYFSQIVNAVINNESMYDKVIKFLIRANQNYNNYFNTLKNQYKLKLFPKVKLQQICEKHNFNTAGNKDVLINRIVYSHNVHHEFYLS